MLRLLSCLWSPTCKWSRSCSCCHQQVHKARPEVRVPVQGSTVSCQVQLHKCISRSTHAHVGKALAGGLPDNHAAHGKGGGARYSGLPESDACLGTALIKGPALRFGKCQRFETRLEHGQWLGNQTSSEITRVFTRVSSRLIIHKA